MTAYGIGVSVGIIVGLVICIFVLRVANTDNNVKTKYDERQAKVRGDAYRYGFFGGLITNAVLLGLSLSGIDLHMLGSSLFFIPIAVGVMVQATYCVFKDGYVGLNTNMPRFIIIMLVISLYNFLVGLRGFREGFLTNGVLRHTFINLICGILCLILIVELAVKYLIDRRGE